MQAKVGDRVGVAITTAGETRTATIIDLRGADGADGYVIEWEDNGHRTVVTAADADNISRLR